MLARGLSLAHAFEIRNPSSGVLRLHGATALTPCCSSVGPFPPEVAPGGSVSIPVELKPGLSTGVKRVEFVVRTSSRDRPVERFALSANLFAEWEVIPEYDGLLKVGMEESARRKLTVVGRCHGAEGLSAIDSIESHSPLAARLVGQPSVSTLPGGITETRRDVEFSIPSSSEAGLKREPLRFHWPDGTTREYEVMWEVLSSLRVSPGGLVLRRDDPSAKLRLLITSQDEPFQVQAVRSRLIDGNVVLPATRGKVHALIVSLDPSHAIGTDRSEEILIETDHPRQSRLSIPVLVLSSED